MESLIYIVGAVLFGLVYPLIKPGLDWPLVAALALIYFGLLRLVAHLSAKHMRRRSIARATGGRPSGSPKPGA